MPPVVIVGLFAILFTQYDKLPDFPVTAESVKFISEQSKISTPAFEIGIMICFNSSKVFANFAVES